VYGTKIRWRGLAVGLAVCGSALATVDTAVAMPEPPGLFNLQAGQSPKSLPEHAIAGKSNAVKVNFGRLKSGRFFANLTDGVSFEAERDLEQDLGNGRFAWVGHAAGDPGNRVVIGVSGDAAAGSFSYRGRLFKLEPRADGSHVLAEVEPGDPAPEMDPVPVADTASTATGGAGGTAADGGPVMDVLVAYTPAVQAAYGAAGSDALIIQAVAEANQAYANSGISARLNLVHTVLTNYTESGDMGTDLSRLRSTSDGYMDELHALRNTYGADLVSLIEHEPQYCGIAYLMGSLSTGFASSAFSVVHRTCATGYYSFAHEIGHNQGAHHDHNNASGAMYAYAYGYQEPYNAFRTVMAYNCSGGCPRIDYFSNPNVQYNGKPTGAANYADNARTINTNAATVAAFRQQAATTAPAAPGSLAALATGSATIDVDWADNSSDESGFYLERSENGAGFIQIASLPANVTGFTDDSLSPSTLYSYRVRAWNSVGSSAFSGIATAETDPAPALLEQVANGELPVAGTVSGSYPDTWDNDGRSESIQERESGGKRNRRYGYLEHKWTFQVQPGASVVLSADVNTTTTTDAFVFSYSTNDSQYIDMFTVDAASSGTQLFSLPASISGTVYVRVRDSVRTAGVVTAHTVAVDQLMIRSENGDGIAPSAPDSMSATAVDTSEISLRWADRSVDEYGFNIERRMQGSTQWVLVGTTGPDVTVYSDSGLQAGTGYDYRAQAFNGSGQSGYSNTASAQTDTQSSTGATIQLNTSGYKVRGSQMVDLGWSGALSSAMDIYREGSRIATVANSGSYTDDLQVKGGGSYQYEVCEASSTTCSDPRTVVF